MQKDHIDDVLLDWSKERPDLATDALAIALRLQSLAKSLAGSLTGEFRALDLEWWEYDVLSVLRRKGSPFQMTASRIAESTHLSGGAMTNRIDGLEKRGFVERIVDPNDRRRVLVQLTGEGKNLVDRATIARFESAKDAVEGLSKSEQSDLSSLLRKLVLANVRQDA